MSTTNVDDMTDQEVAAELAEAEAPVSALRLQLKLASAKLKAAKNQRRLVGPANVDALVAENTAQADVDRLTTLVAERQVAEAERPPERQTRGSWFATWAQGIGLKYEPELGKLFIDGILYDEKYVRNMWVGGVAWPPGQEQGGINFPGASAVEAQQWLWIQEQRGDMRRQLLTRLGYEPDVNQHAEAFIEAISENPTPLDAAILRHFVWQVKRKMLGLPIDHHLMMIFYGKTAGGKTEALKKLLEPVRGVEGVPADTKGLGDDRYTEMFRDYFVLRFDEFGKLKNQDMETVKNRITSEEVTYRMLGGNSMATIINNATLCGSSEKPIGELLVDTKGMRRFGQITTREVADWAAYGRRDGVNGPVDIVAIWKGVDPQTESPIVAHLDDLKLHQEGLRPLDSVEEWIQDRCGQHWELAADAYKRFKSNQEDQGRHAMLTVRQFTARLRGLKIDEDRSNAAGTKGLVFRTGTKPVEALGRRGSKEV